MRELDVDGLAERLGVDPGRVREALDGMGVPYASLPAEPDEAGFYVTADRKWLLRLHSDGSGWGRTEVKGASNNRTSWTEGAQWLTGDAGLVSRTLGGAAFPLMTLEEALAPAGAEGLAGWLRARVDETLMDPTLDPGYRTGRIDGLNEVRRRIAKEGGR